LPSNNKPEEQKRALYHTQLTEAVIMNIVTWDPFKNFNQVFNRYPEYSTALRRETKPTEWQPGVDIYEADEKYLVRAELPGVDKEAVNVSVDENVLTIKGTKQFVEAKDGEQWKRVETQYGEFSRSFTLPEEVNVDQVSAAYKNGVLELSIPKVEPKKAKTIDVKIH
jgi:HSP20 family protein